MRMSGLSFLIVALFLTQGKAQPRQPGSFQPITAMAPEDAGDVLLARQQYLEAIDAYNRAPYDAATLNKIGVAWHHLSAVGQAQKKYQEALSLRPDFPDALNNLGAVYFAEKKYSQAIRLYRRALQVAPDSPVTAVNLGTAYFAEGKHSQGIEAYRTAFRLDSSVFDLDSPNIISGPVTDQERAQLDYCIAELLAQMQDNDRALDYLRRALAAGFRDGRRLSQDPAFATLRLNADYGPLAASFHLD